MTEETETKPELITIRVVEIKGESALIQTADFKRYYAPVSKLDNNRIDKAELDKCQTYGIPWEAYLSMDVITAEALALMLRQVGIYTLGDLQVRDRQLIRVGSRLVGRVVRDAAGQAAQAKPPRRKRDAKR